MKKILTLFSAILIIAPVAALAGGMFVAPKVVWDKHKDISEPAQKAILVYDAGQEDLILQVRYTGPVDEFGWIIPVPNLPRVQNGSLDCFYELNEYAQRHFRPDYTLAMARWQLGIDRRSDQPPELPPPVKVIEIKTVGDYKIAVLSANDSGALERWLADNHFYFPPDKTGVMNSYIQRHWYFVAVKVSLGASFSAVPGSITSELNPLQITFASDHCVFPLKISSMNGKPSEARVYVLSPEPLVERGMLEKMLPTVHTNDYEMAMARAERFEKFRMGERNTNRRFMGATEPDNLPLPPEDSKMVMGMAKTLIPTPDELIPYAKVTAADLADCSASIPRLANKTWWLTEQTWTLQPEEMRDLDFEPAWPVFTALLGTQYGYFADASLKSFGADAIPVILAAMQSTNATARVTAAAIFHSDYGSYESESWKPDTENDPRIVAAAAGWLNDSEPDVRMAGISVLMANWNPQFAGQLIGMIRDKDPDVRFFATGMMSGYWFDRNAQYYIPEFAQMLKDNDPDVRGSALQILQHLRAQIPRDELMSFFNSNNYRVLDAAWAQLQAQGEKLSDNDALTLLQNPEPVARLLALTVLDENPGKQSIELALPLLQDPYESVRFKADQTLCALTGQHFTEQQADEWIKWWDQNKTNFVALP